MKKSIKKSIAVILITGLISSAIPVAAEEKGQLDNVVFSYVNTDTENIKNAKISIEEAENARSERIKDQAGDLDYNADCLQVKYNRSKAAEAAQKAGLKDEFELYKEDIHRFGNDGVKQVLFATTKTVFLIIDLNDNKTAATALKEYEELDYVDSAYMETYVYVHYGVFKTTGIYPIYNNDSITLGCVSENSYKRTKYRWEYCKIGENTWHLISDWNSSEWCTWYPDGNDSYAVVCKASCHGNETVDSQSTWYISRPQMQKKLTGKCAVPTTDGLLFGCTSNVTKNDTDYYTSCYIWSHEKQAWIAQASYQASDCAWFRVSSLPKGTYMMYTCTEKRMSNGEKRKLSCDYYLFAN